MTITIRRPEDVPEGTPMAVSLRSTREITTGNWRTFRPVYVTRPSPCNLDCPAGTDVRAFLAHAARGDAAAAWQTIVERNPLPGICGRVCYHPCEIGCNRREFDDAVAVHAIERAIADEVRAMGGAGLPPSPRRGRTGTLGATHDIAGLEPCTTVAIVGSGPAGLSCAYHAARAGHAATVFEAADELGGMLRYGIPAYRLPRHVLDAEIDFIRRAGVTFKTGMRLGGSLSWDDLRPYDAVFVAVGLQRSRRAAVPGEHLDGVRPAIDFLREVNAGRGTRVSGRVVIIGGGNTAIDAARVAVRQGAHATIVYRRSRAEMPAHPDEITQAEIEGVEFIFQSAPVRFRGWRGMLTSIELQRMRLGAPGADGRRTPEPIPNAVGALACNHALTAIGEELEEDAFEAAMQLARGRLAADRWGRTSAPPLFAGGDAATGAGTVVEAIGSGRRAADAIDAWIAKREPPGNGRDEQRVAVEDLNLFYFPHAPRAPVPPGHGAIGDFHEVTATLGWREAADEATRCFTCGLCTECGNCVTFCPDAAVSPAPGGGYAIDLAHCKGCGVCVTECPRGAMTLVAEGTR